MPKFPGLPRTRGRFDGPSFNGRRLDRRRGGLVGPDGALVPLRPQSLEVFGCLVGQAGETVAKRTLFERVWGDVAVTDDSLTQCIGDIRRALDDSGKTVLETVPRQGFRLHPDTDAPDVGTRVWRRPVPIAAALAAALALGAAFALLPTRSVPIEAGEPTLSIATSTATTALGGDVAAALDRYRGLRRVTDGARFELVLARSAPDRFSAELTDRTDGTVILAATFDGTRDDGSPAELGVRIAALLASPLSGRIPRVLFDEARDKPLERLTRSDCYLHNFQLQGNQNSDEVARRSEACLDRLLEEDPEDARALALRAALYAQQYWWGVGLDGPARHDPALREPLARQALASARAAEALFPPPDAALHYAIARAYYANCRTEHTLAAARRALEINPDDPNILGGVGNWVAYVGHWSEGVALARRAIELAPRGYARWWYWPIGKAAWIAGDHEAALDGFMRAHDENSWLSQLQLAYTLAPLGRKEEAARAVERLRELRPGFTRADARAAYRRWCFDETFIGRMDEALQRAGLADTTQSAGR